MARLTRHNPPVTMPPNRNSDKLSSLDGWRAVSIGLVLLAHCTYSPGTPEAVMKLMDYFDTGGVGVLFFFVISGFLITWLLLREQHGHGGISLRKFYLRRALRILPVYFVYLFVLGVLTQYRQGGAFWLTNLTFTTNFYIPPFPTAHLWSLAVEEQFYLLWPCLLVWRLGRGINSARLLTVLAVPLVMGPAMRLIGCKHWYPETLSCLFQWGSFFYHFDALAFGCFAAVLYTYWRDAVNEYCAKYFRALACLGVGLIAGAVAAHLFPLPARVKEAGIDSLLASGFTLLLLVSVVEPARGLFRWLNWAWVRHLGVLSYSIYIWQQMFCGTGESVFGLKEAWWTAFPFWILSVLVVAHASYYLLEKPLLGLRSKFR